MAGKGDTPRPVDKKKYDREFQRIFKCDSERLKRVKSLVEERKRDRQ